MTKIRILLASASLAFVGGILGIYRFVRGILLVPEFPGFPPYIPPQIVHEPMYLAIGLALILIGISLSYLALHIWRRSRSHP